jgi:hypothetical protein
VDVDMLGEGRAPGVEDGGYAHVAAEMTRVAAKGGERGGRALKEQAVDQAGVALGERVEGVWEGEDDVEVRNRHDLAAAGGEPALGGHALAFGAVAIATGVVGDPFGAAGGCILKGAPANPITPDFAESFAWRSQHKPPERATRG